MSDYGIRVAKDGYDVLTDADQNMAFTSARYSDKVLAYGTATTVMNGGVGDTHGVTITHGLGRAVQFEAFDYLPGSVIIPHAWRDYHGTGASIGTQATMSSNTLTITWEVLSGSVSNLTVTVIYFIFDKNI